MAADRMDASDFKPYTKDGRWTVLHNVNASADIGLNVGVHEFFLNNTRTMDVLLDVELMRRAAYVVGSQTSNFFRMATELNYAYHNVGEKRFLEVDRIPWTKTFG